MRFEGSRLLPRDHVPQHHGVIISQARQDPAARRKGLRPDRRRMPSERSDDLVRGDIPKLHRVIIASRGHEFTSGGKRYGPDMPGVPTKGDALVAAREAPEVAPLET